MNDAYDPFHDRRRRPLDDPGDGDPDDGDADDRDDARGPRSVDAGPLIAALVLIGGYVIWVLWAFY